MQRPSASDPCYPSDLVISLHFLPLHSAPVIVCSFSPLFQEGFPCFHSTPYPFSWFYFSTKPIYHLTYYLFTHTYCHSYQQIGEFQGRKWFFVFCLLPYFLEYYLGNSRCSNNIFIALLRHT